MTASELIDRYTNAIWAQFGPCALRAAQTSRGAVFAIEAAVSCRGRDLERELARAMGARAVTVRVTIEVVR